MRRRTAVLQKPCWVCGFGFVGPNQPTQRAGLSSARAILMGGGREPHTHCGARRRLQLGFLNGLRAQRAALFFFNGLRARRAARDFFCLTFVGRLKYHLRLSETFVRRLKSTFVLSWASCREVPPASPHEGFHFRYSKAELCDVACHDRRTQGCLASSRGRACSSTHSPRTLPHVLSLFACALNFQWV